MYTHETNTVVGSKSQPHLSSSAPTEEAKLGAVLAPDRRKHPERTHATVGRIREVLGSVVDSAPRAEALAAACARIVPGLNGDDGVLDVQAAGKVAAMLVRELETTQIERVISMISESELSTEEVIALHRQHKIPVSQLEDDVLPVRGDGAVIRDSLGREFLDLDSNYSATNLGNSNHEIATGLYNQARQLISQKEDRVQVARARFIKLFRGMLPESLHCFYWQNSGGEAVDKALKMAKAYTGNTGVVAFEGGFHGRTHGAVAVTHNLKYRSPFGLDREHWVHFASFGDLEAVERLLASGKARSVILELVQGEEAGVRPASEAFAHGLRGLCDKYGAVLIADEVQTGFARVAGGEDQWFACQRYGIVPDLITIGKSFGGGFPVTAVVTHTRISEAMRPGYDGSTFGGNPLAMTAALIATRQMRELNLPVEVVKRSRQVSVGLERIDSPLVLDVRAVGLMVGIDLPNAETVHQIQERMLDLGVLSSLSTGATMRWMPPLVITEQQVDKVLAAFEQAVREIGSR